MPDYENIFLTFKLHDNWLEPNHDVPVRLATCMINLCWRKKIDSIPTSISVIKFILITVGEVLGIRLLFEPPRRVQPEKKRQIPRFHHKSCHHRRQHPVHRVTSRSIWCREGTEPSARFVARSKSTPAGRGQWLAVLEVIGGYAPLEGHRRYSPLPVQEGLAHTSCLPWTMANLRRSYPPRYIDFPHAAKKAMHKITDYLQHAHTTDS